MVLSAFSFNVFGKLHKSDKIHFSEKYLMHPAFHKRPYVIEWTFQNAVEKNARDSHWMYMIVLWWSNKQREKRGQNEKCIRLSFASICSWHTFLYIFFNKNSHCLHPPHYLSNISFIFYYKVDILSAPHRMHWQSTYMLLFRVNITRCIHH